MRQNNATVKTVHDSQTEVGLDCDCKYATVFKPQFPHKMFSMLDKAYELINTARVQK